VFTLVAFLLGLGAVRQNWPWILTGTVNWMIAAQNQWPLMFAHLWSVCVQEQFYLFWPLLILFLPRNWILPTIVSVALAGLAFRVGCVLLDVPMIARWVLPFGSLDSLAAGAALGWCGARLKPNPGNWIIAAIALWMLVVAAVLRNSDPTQLKSVLVEPLEAAAFVILIARAAAGFPGALGRFLTSPGLVFAGRISYGLYIYHILVAMVLSRWLPSQLRFLITIPSLRLLVFGIVTVIVATLSWYFLEHPINRLRRAATRKALAPVLDNAREQERPSLRESAPLFSRFFSRENC